MRIGRRTMIGGIATLLVVLIGIAVVVAAGIAGWEYTNSDQFCANMCHAVHPEESLAHKESAHARVHCVECHMGRTSTLHLMALKPTHLKELWGMIAGYERPTYSSTLRPAREACESCHWPSAEHHDSIAVNKRFGTDPKSSATDYRLTLHTSANIEREIPWKVTGIHWHIDNDVQIKAADPQRREIPWVQVRRADGTTSTFVDATSRLSKAEIEKLPARRMECFDCHNQAGHPFLNPSRAVDEAIAAGKIDRSLPLAKSRAEDLIVAAASLSGPRAERAATIDKLIAESMAKANVPATDKAKEAKFAATMKEILLASTFDEKGFTWKSFPNHAGHSDTPGCFRCHNGKHVNEKGEAIRLQCTLCHDLPQVKREAGVGSVASTVIAGVTPPPSHNEPNFMLDHRTRLDQSCEGCHGPLKFGNEGGNFCANPACHGRKWPGLDLNAVKVAAVGTAAAPAAKAAAPGAPSGGEAVADKLGCLGCHGVDEKKMGPALKDAAKKLAGKTKPEALAAKLGKGDGHPAVSGSDADLKKAAEWVLSLAGGAGAAKAADAKADAKKDAPAGGQALADKAGCLACHALSEQKMGPALKTAGPKWKGKESALAAKLAKGDGHPGVAASDSDLKAIVSWATSLK
ncbi:MAG: cytochrome c family protein [Proteobacteria bacterium]|nr:cytochrome c family protein [Pseudomonadota bacterium]